jgi:hypothetical protein
VLSFLRTIFWWCYLYHFLIPCPQGEAIIFLFSMFFFFFFLNAWRLLLYVWHFLNRFHNWKKKKDRCIAIISSLVNKKENSNIICILMEVSVCLNIKYLYPCIVKICFYNKKTSVASLNTDAGFS